MKKILAFVLALTMSFALVSCGGGAGSTSSTGSTGSNTTDGKDGTTLTLWTYPVGEWGKEETVNKLMDDFKAETGITVKVEYLAYADGDDKVNTALAGGNAPDLILEGPERLVANWGDKGYMVDLSDLLDDADKADINAAALDACTHTSGAVYEYPLVMTAHCMGINLDAFKEAGADKYLDLENHTWTTEDFKAAMTAMYDHFGTNVGAVYCGGQGGDQGTRALVNNLYGGTFTNPEHTVYTWDDPKNVQALQELYDMEAISYDPSLQGGDEIALFYNETLKMAFCWNIQQQLNPNGADTGANKTLNGQTIVPMAFPSEDGKAALQGGIWGFGIFDNGDDAKIEAAKKFIKYMCDSAATVDAVKAATFFPVRSDAEGTDLSTVWADNEVMNEYSKLMPYLGDYYQVTAGWAEARTAWWNMLQEVNSSGDVSAAVENFCAQANAAAGN